jgi:serine/threonine protein kinase
MNEVRFGPYRLVERIGAGGMAEVHRALLDGPGGFQQTVVIKRILRHLGDDPAFARMLLTEARLTALLHHPNIVQVHAVGEVEGVYYLAMEHVDGIDLSSLLRAARGRLPVPPAVACAIAAEVATALAYAHTRTDADGRPCAIVHRDVSPANVMVAQQGTVKLLDFGIAKAADSLRDVETRTGTLKGKVGYMSPEQASGEAVDARSDVFSLGVVLHELLTMQRLFHGDDDLQTLKLVRAAAVAPPGVDDALDAVVMKMLARRADDRFASCDALLAALRPIAHRLHADRAAVRVYLEALGPVERVVRRLPTPRDTQTVDPAVSRPPPRRWKRVAMGGAIAAAALSLLMIGGRAPPVTATAAQPASLPSLALPAPSIDLPAPRPSLPARHAPTTVDRRRPHPTRPAPAHPGARDLYDPFAHP